MKRRLGLLSLLTMIGLSLWIIFSGTFGAKSLVEPEHFARDIPAVVQGQSEAATSTVISSSNPITVAGRLIPEKSEAVQLFRLGEAKRTYRIFRDSDQISLVNEAGEEKKLFYKWGHDINGRSVNFWCDNQEINRDENCVYLSSFNQNAPDLQIWAPEETSYNKNALFSIIRTDRRNVTIIHNTLIYLSQYGTKGDTNSYYVFRLYTKTYFPDGTYTWSSKIYFGESFVGSTELMSYPQGNGINLWCTNDTKSRCVQLDKVSDPGELQIFRTNEVPPINGVFYPTEEQQPTDPEELLIEYGKAIKSLSK